MARHIYDKDGNYKGEIITDLEKKERDQATLGCLGVSLLLLVLVYPIFLTVYYLLGNENNKAEDVLGNDEKIGCFTLPMLFYATLANSTSDNLTEAEKRYRQRVIKAIIITISLFIISLFFVFPD